MAKFCCIILESNGFASGNLHHQDESDLILSNKHKYVHLKTHLASHTMHQNLVNLRVVEERKLFNPHFAHLSNVLHN